MWHPEREMSDYNFYKFFNKLKVIILTTGMGSKLEQKKPKSLIDIDNRKLIDIQLSEH